MNDLSQFMFAPSKASGQQLRSHINNRFASSFEYLLSACKTHVDVPSEQLAELLSRMRNGSKESAYLFALHFQLIDAIEAGTLDEVQSIIEIIASCEECQQDVVLTDLRPEVFPWNPQVIAQYFSAEEDSVFAYSGPSATALPGRNAQIQAAQELLRRTAAGFQDEFQELNSAVVLAKGVPQRPIPLEDRFGGASALRAFGAILMNVDEEPSTVECAISLVHEQSHSVLFALSPMDGVVKNLDDERYSSPLRDDARPLEGIFHATFVIARIVCAVAQMRESGKLSKTEEEVATIIRQGNIPLFFDGQQTLRRHARLTEQGQIALDAAEAYMSVHR